MDALHSDEQPVPPLANVPVLRFGTSQVGAHAARRLADRGATVVAVQPNAAGRALLCQLISHCDVVIADKEANNGLKYQEVGRQLRLPRGGCNRRAVTLYVSQKR
jgi:NAD(P)-dependent dehydrogenase (short-subunit alcohol dehydrogenase family)